MAALYDVTVTRRTARGSVAGHLSELRYVPGKAKPDRVVVAHFTKAAQGVWMVGYGVTLKWGSSAAKARFSDYCDSLSMGETLEALSGGNRGPLVPWWRVSSATDVTSVDVTRAAWYAARVSLAGRVRNKRGLTTMDKGIAGPMADLYAMAADSLHELVREARNGDELSELEGMLRRAASGTQFAQVHPEAIKALSDAWELCSAY